MQTQFFFVKNTRCVVAATSEKSEDSNLIPSHAYYQKPNGELVRAKRLDGHYVKHMLIPVPQESVEIN